MSRARPEFHSGSPVYRVFWVPAAGAAFLVPGAWLGVPAIPLAFLGIIIGALAGMFVAWSVRGRFRAVRSEQQHLPSEFASDPDLVHLYQILHQALVEIASQPAGEQRATLTQKLIALGVQFRRVASGTASFTGSASWYVAHDAILTVPGLKEYLAVVWVRVPADIHNPATQESLRATYAAVRRGVLVERVLVLPDFLWAADRILPTDDIRPWIEDQHNHGLRVILLRERDLVSGTGEVIDTCVFDDWGVGTRDSDDRDQTLRVTLDFAPDAIRIARERLDRLSQIGIPYGELLERADRSR